MATTWGPGRFARACAVSLAWCAATADLAAAQSSSAPRVGTWSTSRSAVGFARADAFDGARARVGATLPGVRYVELEALDPAALGRVDVVILDSTPQRALAPAELEALRAFWSGGGDVVAQVYGAAGTPVAALFGLTVGSSADAAVHELAVSGAPAGPFGAVARYQNRYETTIGVPAGATGVRVLASDAGGARAVYLPPAGGRGGALLVTNLFAWGDADWSVGGLVEGPNDNLALLGNFLAQAAPPPAPAPAPAARTWEDAYRAAALAAVRGDPGPLRAWAASAPPAPAEVRDRVTAWLAAPALEVDPRFFPTDGILLGSSTRKALLAADHRPNEVSKWTFDVGPLTWMCLEGKQDLCYEVSTAGELPAAWAAAGLATRVPPEELARRLEDLGYTVHIGVASESPFGRQVVAKGFGVLWQGDYSHREQGEELLSLRARKAGG